MSSSEFDLYQVDHLFLLIGENPLPNYVAAKLLLKPGGTVYLVYTTGTVSQQKNLAEVLEKEKISIQTVPLDDYESDAYHIREILKDWVEDLPGKGSIGLNYTGGTKAMAVHAYRTVSDLERDDTIFSYLDSRYLEMCIDREYDERINEKVKLPLSLDTIFKLHIPDLSNPPTREPILPKIVQELAQHPLEWSKWIQSIFFEQAKKNKQNGQLGWKCKTEFQKLQVNLDSLPERIISSFCEEGLLSNEHLDMQKFFQSPLSSMFSQKSPSSDDIGKWFNGCWLEDYVLHKIIELSQKQSNLIHDYGKSFNVPPNSGLKDDKGFEFDVAFMHYHQLFAISCTTDTSKYLCKSKLFEANIRANQMGGDETRVALVCLFDNPDLLKAEMEVSRRSSKIQVFGRDDLPNLSQKIEEWIKDNDREARR